MADINVLISACGAEVSTLRADAQQRMHHWSNWLQPISAETPCGADPAYDDQFLLIREEVNKLSGIDTALITSLTEPLLSSVSKDIRIISFYLWARLHQDGETGLAEGVELLAAALQHFGTELHPQRPRSRQAALAWLGSARMLDSLSLWPEADLDCTRRICGGLLLVSEALQEDERAAIQPLINALEVRLAQNGGADAMVPQHSAEEFNTGRDIDASSLKPVNSGENLKAQAKVLATYLREQPGGWLAAHHLMKSVRWDTMTQLPALGAGGNTRLLTPKPEHRAHLKRLYLQQSWLELIELTDSLFSQATNHLWLDLQWYAWEALTRSNKESSLATIIEQDLNALLLRLPGLETLTFADGTPFADDVTLNWIAQRVTGGGAYHEPETMVNGTQPESDVLALEAEALEKADAEGVDAALYWLQLRPGVSSVRDQWLLRLLMARVCEQFGRNDMALHLLGELNTQADGLTLPQWSPDLMFEVRARRLKLLRVKAARGESDRVRLQPEMDTLLSGLITIDPARAAVLCG